MFTSRVTKLKRLRDSAPADVRSAEGRHWVRAVTFFFSDKLHDRKIAHVIEQVAKGGTAISARMTRRQRRAEILELLDAEIDTGATPRTIPPAEVQAVRAARRKLARMIVVAMIIALAALLLVSLRTWDGVRH